MAAATIANSKYHSAGDMQFVTFNLTSVADTNTLDTGLGEVDNVIVTVEGSSAAYDSYTPSTVLGQIRITFKMSATVNLTVTVLGR